MKSLVLYYSFDGNTDFIARGIAEEVGSDIERIKTKNEIASHGFMKYFWGGRQVVMKEKPDIEDIYADLNSYNLIFIGSPVWVSTFVPALRSFFSKYKLQGKKVALFCCCGGNKGKTFEEMKKELAGNEIVGELEIIEPKKKDGEEKAAGAKEWARGIVMSNW
mgnify:CR=1 FL=1